MSLARAASVRLGGVVLFLSYKKNLSENLYDRDQDWNTYDMFDASKSYHNIGLRICAGLRPQRRF